MLHDPKIFLQREWVSQILFVYLPCHIRVLLVWFYNTKVSENSDMTISWATYCCSGCYINDVELKCCGIKDLLFWWNTFLALAMASLAMSWVSISNGLLWYCTILTQTELCLFFSSMHWKIKSGLALAFLPRDSAEIASELASLLSLLVRLTDFDVGVLSKFRI